MIDNAGLVIRPFVALLFLFGGVLLLRASPARLGAACITAGAVLFLGAELYGVFTLRPYIGRFFDEDWRWQIGAVDVVATIGLLLCAAGVVVHAFGNATQFRTAAATTTRSPP